MHVGVKARMSTLNPQKSQVLPVMSTAFPNVSGLFKQYNGPCHTAKAVQEWFEEHDIESNVSHWLSNSSDLNLGVKHLIKHLWGVLDK